MPNIEDPTIWGWMIWYADGTSYNSRTTQWADLSSKGVLCAQSYESGTNSGGDHRIRFFKGIGYYWQDPAGNMTIYRADSRPPGISNGYIKKGETTDFTYYDAALVDSDNSGLFRE